MSTALYKKTGLTLPIANYIGQVNDKTLYGMSTALCRRTGYTESPE